MERRRFGMKWYWIALVAIVLFASFPFISVLIASSLAESHGCVLNEGSVHPCIIAGADWGSALYTMGVLGWLMLATFPIGFVLFLVWLVILAVHRAAWGRKERV
ncbi:MAG TPA: hypothetical protein VIL88_09500 [Devosia sp.]|jgi:hypothetical protein|uniref:hypothetical protein n=1 Tax=Devosia sp. TaxID=1871048 RepID=UPI002F93B0C4